MKKMMMLLFMFSLLSVGLNNFAFAKITPTSVASSASVNINTANEAELSTLKGLGKSRAAAIVTYRKNHGDFKKVEDLADIKGISAKIVARLVKQNAGRIVVRASH